MLADTEFNASIYEGKEIIRTVMVRYHLDCVYMYPWLRLANRETQQTLNDNLCGLQMRIWKLKYIFLLQHTTCLKTVIYFWDFFGFRKCVCSCWGHTHGIRLQIKNHKNPFLKTSGKQLKDYLIFWIEWFVCPAKHRIEQFLCIQNEIISPLMARFCHT